MINLMKKKKDFTTKKLDHISKVHFIFDKYVAVCFDESESDEQVEVSGADVFGRPQRVPHGEYVIVGEFALEIEQKPTIGEIEHRVIAYAVSACAALGVHELVQLIVENFDQKTHVCEFLVHFVAVQKVTRQFGH
jgi:hypothetical protein